MKKKIVLLLIIMALCLVGCGKKEEKKDEVKKTGPLRLVKLNDFDVTTTQTIYFKSKGDYMFLSSYSRLTGKDEFTIFKNGEVIKEVDGDVRELTLGRYVLRGESGEKYNLVDYDGIGIDEKTTYDYIGYAGDNKVIAQKGKKAGLLTTEGKTVIDFEYKTLQEVSRTIIHDDHATTDIQYYKYLFAEKDGKVGVIDFENNVVVPFEYDTVKYEADWDAGYYLGDTFILKDKVFFSLYKGNKEYVFNESGKKILEETGNIYNDGEKFYTTGKSELNKTYYDIDGNVLEDVAEAKRDMTGLDYPDTIRNDVDLDIYVYKNKVVYFDSKNDRHELENVYYEDYVGYYITSEIYFTKTKSGFELHSLKDGSLIDTYDEVSVSDDEDEAFIICKDKKCGLIDFSGKELLPVEYEKHVGSYIDRVYFKNGNEYATYYNYELYKYSCSEGNGIENDVLRAGENYFIAVDKKEHTYMYNAKCEKADTGRLRNSVYVDGLDIIISELWDSQESKMGKDTYDYVIFNDKGELVEFENKDEAKFTFYLGAVEGTPYFLTDKGMYYLTNE